MKHASIVPLIGGETLGAVNAYGKRPEYFLSYSPFKNNDQHILNYYENEIPYYLLDEETPKDLPWVDVIHTVCPCAGLSMLSHSYSSDSDTNKWMYETAKYVLGERKPTVFWGENAPALANKIGEPVRKRLYNIGKENGYSMSIFVTRSMLHGLPQVRNRSFYFFWKDDKVPLFDYFDKPHKKIQDVILDVKANSLMEPINKKKPTDDPYYQFILEEIHGGITHREFFDQLDQIKSPHDVSMYIESKGYTYIQIAEWMKAKGYEKEVERCKRRDAKLRAGGNIMRRGTMIPKDYIGAFVGHYPMMLAHPHEDRYITYREGLSIMGMPEDFELLEPKKNYNHMCQNVPVRTATDMATQVKKYLDNELYMVDADFIIQNNVRKQYEADVRRATVDQFFS